MPLIDKQTINIKMTTNIEMTVWQKNRSILEHLQAFFLFFFVLLVVVAPLLLLLDRIFNNLALCQPSLFVSRKSATL